MVGAVLLNEIQTQLSEDLDAAPDVSGMHVVAGLAPARAARSSDAELSDLALQALLLGYAGFTPQEIRRGVSMLRRQFSED